MRTYFLLTYLLAILWPSVKTQEGRQMPAFLSLQYSVNYDIVSWTCGPINSGSMRLRRDKQLLNNYGTTMKQPFNNMEP